MLKRLDLSAAVIILLFLIISFIPVPLLQQRHIFIKILLGAAFLSFAIKERRGIFKSADFPLWFFLAAISINIFFAKEKGIASGTYADLAIPMFVIYYLLSDRALAKDKFYLLAGIISMASIAVSVIAIFEAVFAFNPIYEYLIENPFYRRYVVDFVRPVSTQFNPAVLGSYLLGCLPFNLFLFKKASVRMPFMRFLGGMGLILCTVVMILAFSRGVFLAFIAMVLFYFIAQKRYRAVVMVFAALLVFGFTCFHLPYPFNRFGPGMTNWGDSVFSDYRFTRCAMAGEMLKDNPLTGIGFQHFRIRFNEYYTGEYKVPHEFMIADNMYLTMLAETGLIGFSAFFIFISFILIRGWRRFAARKDFKMLILLCAFIGLLVNMAAYELFYWPNQYMFFCILAGLIAAFCGKEENEG
jgi:O-antigen ligase